MDTTGSRDSIVITFESLSTPPFGLLLASDTIYDPTESNLCLKLAH